MVVSHLCTFLLQVYMLILVTTLCHLLLAGVSFVNFNISLYTSYLEKKYFLFIGLRNIRCKLIYIYFNSFQYADCMYSQRKPMWPIFDNI